MIRLDPNIPLFRKQALQWFLNLGKRNKGEKKERRKREEGRDEADEKEEKID